ncbi:MAG: hypothetical protein H6718_12365 [Polyangiaceae bacterium]|nr:hypothetical protein [Polyangiaceae bacterium]MCB9606864.1 hypothetical protein [Polyangiaceae bacterium]
MSENQAARIALPFAGLGLLLALSLVLAVNHIKGLAHEDNASENQADSAPASPNLNEGPVRPLNAGPVRPVRQNPELGGIIKRLAATDKPTRDQAMSELLALRNQPFSGADGLALIAAAGNQYPSNGEAYRDTPTALLEVAGVAPHVAYVSAVRKVYPKLTTFAQTQALRLLSTIDDRSAATTLVELLEQGVVAGTAPALDVDLLRQKPRFSDVYFPRLFKSAKGKPRYGVLSLALAYAAHGELEGAALREQALPLMVMYAPLHEAITKAQRKGGPNWLYEEPYLEAQDEAEILLDLMGYVPTAEVEQPLEDALKLKAPRLVCFAALSLVRHGVAVDPAALERIAANPEMRGTLFDGLGALERESLFPEKYKTQQAFAEWDMVHWLVYPTELGRPPDEIELMQVISEDTKTPEGVMEWYLFRFRMKAPHSMASDGWMAGVSGPFQRSEAPSTRSYGDTFSSFTKWSERTPEEHVADVRALIAKHQAANPSGGIPYSAD